MDIKLIERREILQRADRETPQIGRLDIINIDGNLFEVPYWFTNGKVTHVGDPRPVEVGAKAYLES